MYGFTGNILHVDLSQKTLEIEQPDEQFYRTYMGGSLIGLYYLWRFSPPGVEPLHPDNTLTFAVSAPTGLPVSGQSRATVTCKSPSSGGVADSQAGGFWPAELKFAGFDAIVIRGAAESPVYLWVHDGRAELRDAAHLWGKTTLVVDTQLKEELGDKSVEIAQIGPAGEKLANFAAIMNMANRAWGRTGVGAVMGSKKLKAIVVGGNQDGKRKVEPGDKTAVIQLIRQGTAEMESSGAAHFGRIGTPRSVMANYGAGGLPSFNWNAGVMPAMADAEALSGETLYDNLLRGAAAGQQDKVGRDTCYACAIRCKRVVEAEWRDKQIIPEYGGPEYESIATLGSYCGVTDLEAVCYANQLCNEYGVDTISCGATIAWAMECYENEVLNWEETDGIPLRFGDAAAMIAMLEKTLLRDGFGDILAEGSAKAADRLGKGHEFLLTVKGQELPAHMPHVKRSLGLIYAVNPFGADHESSDHDPLYQPKVYEGTPERPGTKRHLASLGLTDPQPPQVLNAEKVKFALQTQYNYSAAEVVDVCHFVFGTSWQLYGPQEMADLMAAATGWEVTLEELQMIGRRRVNLMRAYNAREGLVRADDTLPAKLFKQALKGGRSEGFIITAEELENALVMYYEQAGWDPETGKPTPETLREVGLDWIAEEWERP
ncbi:MAG: aldehyde ferredoxin oxidoreductase family protein [Ardenticatenaceae bacterium]|nr:aldehyde ferredoxin oxidoreductase family protein [Ardenticatenaceae bacterium]